MTEVALDIAAARHVLGVAGDDDVACLLNAAGEPRVPLPSAEQAAWTLLDLHIGAILDGIVGPEQGMRLIADEVYKPAKLGPTQFRPHRNTHDILRLIALEEEYDEIRRHEQRAGLAETSDKRRAGVDARVLHEAREWMERNGSGSAARRLF